MLPFQSIRKVKNICFSFFLFFLFSLVSLDSLYRGMYALTALGRVAIIIYFSGFFLPVTLMYLGGFDHRLLISWRNDFWFNILATY